MITATIGRRVAKLALAVPFVLALVAGSAGADQPPIKVGVVFSFSGAGLYSKMVDLGIAAFQKMHGDTVAGRKIEIIRRDDAYSADGARRPGAMGGFYPVDGIFLRPTGLVVSEIALEMGAPFVAVEGGDQADAISFILLANADRACFPEFGGDKIHFSRRALEAQGKHCYWLKRRKKLFGSQDGG